VILAAIMLKVGAYGFLRFSLPITPDASHKLAGVMIALSLIAIVYIGLVALMQTDIEKTGGVLIHFTHGFCYAGHFHFQRVRD
jgi:NADH dehydrogenase subunit M (EC 1.6.5.3)